MTVSNRRSSLRSLALALAAAVALGATACTGSGEGSGGPGGASDGTVGDAECKTGANAAFATPAGTAFVLPAGVELDGEISGQIDPRCVNEKTVEYGGDMLPVCFGLKNTTGAAITVKLPAGLVFLSKSFGTQNGIILQDHEITVEPGVVRALRIDLFCLNEACHWGTSSDLFSFGAVSSDPGIGELVDLAKTRKPFDRNATQTVYLFGQAVWDVTGGRGLGAERRQQIAETADGA